MNTAPLDALARSLTGPFAFCGVGFSHRGTRSFHVAAAPGIEAGAGHYWRAASISKIVVGQTARALFAEETVEAALGLPFRAPGGSRPTVAQLASHQAGVSDAAGYLVPSGQTLDAWLTEQGDAIWSGAAPGTRFEYSNLGYLVLAACCEARTGLPFQTLAARHVLGPAGVSAGFNWAGVPGDMPVLPTYRRGTDGQFLPQIDAPRPPKDPVPATYRPGRDAAALSPQGGLRLSLEGALKLAEALPRVDLSRGWSADPARTLGPAEVFGSYHWGVQHFAAPSFYPRPLRGHFANAYGMVGGIWWDEVAKMAFAMVLNGLPEDDDPEDDRFRPEELALFEAVAQVP